MLLNQIKEKLNGKSIKKLGEEVGLSYPAIHNICNITDLSTIQIGNVATIARTLNVEVTELYREIVYRVFVYSTWTNEAGELMAEPMKHVYDGNSVDDCKDFIKDNFCVDYYVRIARKRKDFNVYYEMQPFEIIENEEPIHCQDLPRNLGIYDDAVVFSITEIIELEDKRDALNDLIEHIGSLFDYSNTMEIVKDNINYWTSNYFELTAEAEVKEIDIDNLNDSEIVSEFKKQLQEVEKELKEVKDALKILKRKDW